MRLLHLKTLTNKSAAGIMLGLLLVLVTFIASSPIMAAGQTHPRSSAKKPSTYFIFTAGGQYKTIQVTASPGFSRARCRGRNIPAGKSISLPLKAKSGQPVAMNCATPSKATDSYSILFYPDQTPQKPVEINQTASSCIFVHSHNAPNAPLKPRILARNPDGSCSKAPETASPPSASPNPPEARPSPSPRPAPQATGLPSGKLYLVNDGRFKRVAIGVTTKGVVEATVPSNKARCTYNGKSYHLARQKLGKNKLHYIYVDIVGKKTLTIDCTSSPLLVYFLKQGETIDSVYKFSRQAPSIATSYCTYVHRNHSNKREKYTNANDCPAEGNTGLSPGEREDAILIAKYTLPNSNVPLKHTVIGRAYDQVFILKLKSGQRMSPEECAGEIGISHPELNVPARNYHINYIGSKNCVFRNHVTGPEQAGFKPKIDKLHLVFSGNDYVKSASRDLPIDRRAK